MFTLPQCLHYRLGFTKISMMVEPMIVEQFFADDQLAQDIAAFLVGGIERLKPSGWTVAELSKKAAANRNA